MDRLIIKHHANERLRDAASDLLAACKAMLEDEPYGLTPHFDEAMRLVERAVAKAESQDSDQLTPTA